MKKRKKALSQLLFMVIGTILLGMTPAAADTIQLRVQPQISTVSPGQSFSVDIVIDNILDLYAYQFDLSFTFSASVLEAISLTEGSFLSSYGNTFFIPGMIDNTNGVISFTANTLLGPSPGVSGSGVLATITFNALAPGTSLVDFLNAILLDSTGADIQFSSRGGIINVEETHGVPEPSSHVLVGYGLLALAGLGIRIRTGTF